MSVTSKTGLIPSVKKNSKVKVKEVVSFEVPNLVVPAPFTLRPFAGIYNPFPYGCSVLCNHPTDFEAKEILQKAKDALAAEGKCSVDLEVQSLIKNQKRKDTYKPEPKSHEKEDESPKNLNFKYDENNIDFSGLLTPAPSLISLATKIPPTLRTRRCFTPDPSSFMQDNKKTHLVLDLRRSHSQETFCLQKNQPKDFDFDSAECETFASAEQMKRKRPAEKKSATSNFRIQDSEDSGRKIRSKSLSKSSLFQDYKNESIKSLESNGNESCTDLEKVVKRRGKKRKGNKSKKNGPREGDKEFKGIPDPNETQVSALGSESQNDTPISPLSRKVSLKDEEQSLSNGNLKKNSEENKPQNSFLNPEILRHFQRELDQEAVDAEMDRRRKKALAEAFCHKIQAKTHHKDGEEIKLLKNEFETPVGNPETWLSMPRVFSRRSARFELPMDSRLLKDLTPFSYVQSFVFPSPARLILYNYVFKLYTEDVEEDEESVRIILGKNVCNGLGKIMGRTLTADEAENFQRLIGWRDEDRLDFRTFAGIGATCERLQGPNFCSEMPNQIEDPRHEVEIADFEALEGKLNRLKPKEKMATMLRSIRDL